MLQSFYNLHIPFRSCATALFIGISLYINITRGYWIIKQYTPLHEANSYIPDPYNHVVLLNAATCTYIHQSIHGHCKLIQTLTNAHWKLTVAMVMPHASTPMGALCVHVMKAMKETVSFVLVSLFSKQRLKIIIHA